MKRKSSQNGREKLSTRDPLFCTSPMGCFTASGYTSVGSMPGAPVPVTLQQRRIPALGVAEGVQVALAASGAFYPAHIELPVSAYFFNLSDDDAPSPYLGLVELSQLSNQRGYHVPKKGSI